MGCAGPQNKLARQRSLFVPGQQKINRSNYAVWRAFQRFVAKNTAGINERNSSTVLASGVLARVTLIISPVVRVPLNNSKPICGPNGIPPPPDPPPGLVYKFAWQLKKSRCGSPGGPGGIPTISMNILWIVSVAPPGASDTNCNISDEPRSE